MFRFLLVSLAIDAILGGITVSERKRKLDEMTRGNHLGDVYGTTLERIKAQKGSRSRLGMDTLMWVSNSERPLGASELCHALGVRMGSTDLDVENVPTIRALIGCSLGLITIEASSSIVRLVHFTLQEYLSSNPSLFQSPHSMMAEVCLMYLNFRCVRELCPTLVSALPIVPFIEYASCYWGKHLVKEKTDRATPLALLLLIGYEEHIASRLLLLHYHESWDFQYSYFQMFVSKGFTGLHGAAFHGIGEVVPALLATKEWSINERDNNGRAALSWAAVGGHEDVVNILLQLRDIDPNVVDTKYGRTPLWWAAGRGHEGIVRMLLERGGVNPNTADAKYGRTPLWWAAKRGDEGMVRILLKQADINPNIADTEFGRTPLWWAAERGHEGIVRMLLERADVNPNTAPTEFGRTPLWWAAERGHVGIVRMLLKREDINPNTADTQYGHTPLRCAAERSHEGMVKLLLQQEDVDPNTPDTKYGRTPLWWTAWRGYEGAARMLLDRADINPDTADTEHGWTPLRCVAERGHEGIVKLLLERADINPNTPDTRYGQTPLWWAAERGHEGIVKMLLERRGVNPNTADTEYGRAPLWWAAARGHEGIVRMLLEREGVNLNTADTQYGQTPLWWAAECGHEGIVKLLLEQEDIDPNTLDTRYGQTPFLRAAQHGCDGIVRLLLEREDLNPDIPGPNGETALDLAAFHEHAGVVRLLSKPWPSLPILVDTRKAADLRRNTLPQENLLSNSKKRKMHLSDGGEQRKKHQGAPT